MSKKNPNGKVVLYTEQGAKVVTADIEIYSEIAVGAISPKFRKSTLDAPKDLKYAIVGVAKTTPTNTAYTLPPTPFIIDEALKFTQTKFFRLIIDLMKIAQFDPYDGGYAFGTDRFHDCCGKGYYPRDFDIDYSVSVPEIDAQLYRKYSFSAAMIEFVERRYSYDDGAGLEPR